MSFADLRRRILVIFLSVNCPYFHSLLLYLLLAHKCRKGFACVFVWRGQGPTLLREWINLFCLLILIVNFFPIFIIENISSYDLGQLCSCTLVCWASLWILEKKPWRINHNSRMKAKTHTTLKWYPVMFGSCKDGIFFQFTGNTVQQHLKSFYD